MTEPGSYRISEINRSVERELERLHAQTLLGWRQESRALAQFGLRDGMSVLELGSGPGFVTEQLLRMLPNTIVTAMDIDPLMIEQSERYLSDKRADRVRIVEASIMAIPLPDNSYDFALARFLFQHLPDPIGAAQEVLRVLKPGGKLAIHDIDVAIGGAAEPATPKEIEAIYERAGQIQVKKGGNPKIGRLLPRILRQAGFQQLDLDIMIVHSDLVGMDAIAILWEADQLWPAVQAGVVTEEEYLKVKDYLEQVHTSPESLDMYTLLFACGRKPLPSA